MPVEGSVDRHAAYADGLLSKLGGIAQVVVEKSSVMWLITAPIQ